MGTTEDLLAYVNANMPLRPILWKWDNPDVAYDGDPNDGGAPTILNLSPAGTFYTQSTGERWIKEVIGAWGVSDASSLNYVTFTVDPVLGDDANDGITAPIKTLLRASQMVHGKHGIRFLLKAGIHRITDVYQLPSSPAEAPSEVCFGSISSTVTLQGEVAIDDTFVVLSQVNNIITKDGSSSDWTPGEHVGRYIYWTLNFGPPYGVFSFRVPIINNTATELEVAAYDTWPPGAPPAVASSVDITHPTTIIKPPISGSGFDNALKTEGFVYYRDIEFDGEDGLWIFADYNKQPGSIRIEGCTFKDVTYGLQTTSFLNITSCHFKNMTYGAILYYYGARLQYCHAEGCDNLVRVELGAILSFYGVISLKDGTRLLRIGDGAQMPSLNAATFKLDGVTDFCQMDGDGLIQSGDLEFVPGFESVTRYGFYLVGSRNRLELHDTGASTLVTPTSYFRINADLLSAADYLLDDANVEFPRRNEIQDI